MIGDDLLGLKEHTGAKEQWCSKTKSSRPKSFAATWKMERKSKRERKGKRRRGVSLAKEEFGDLEEMRTTAAEVSQAVAQARPESVWLEQLELTNASYCAMQLRVDHHEAKEKKKRAGALEGKGAEG